MARYATHRRRAGLVSVVMLALIIGLVFFFVAYRGSEEVAVITVTEKERVTQNTSEGVTSKYLVWTEGETFEVTDTFVFGRFDSSDVYGRLRVGGTYEVSVAGWRIPLFSMYRNIIEVRGER